MGLYKFFGLTLDLSIQVWSYSLRFQLLRFPERIGTATLSITPLSLDGFPQSLLPLAYACTFLGTSRHSTIFRMVASFLDRCHTIRFTQLYGTVPCSLCGTVFTGVFHRFSSFSGYAAKIFDDLLLVRSQLPTARTQISGQKSGYP